MKTDDALQKDVRAAINWEPLLNLSKIEVIAKDGSITLLGSVDLYAKKIVAESSAKNVIGVKSITNKIVINFDASLHKTDDEIIIEVKKDMTVRQIPSDKVTVLVKDGWVTLEGELKWNYQKEEAKDSINYIIGVKGITNNIKLELETHDQIEKGLIEKALARSSSVNSKNIQIKVMADRVTLNGKVASLYEKGEAEKTVWNTPGVWNLDNELTVE